MKMGVEGHQSTGGDSGSGLSGGSYRGGVCVRAGDCAVFCYLSSAWLVGNGDSWNLVRLNGWGLAVFVQHYPGG